MEEMKYLTTKEFAAKTGKSEQLIRKWCRDGKLKAVVAAEKKNGRWMIPSTAVCPEKRK